MAIARQRDGSRVTLKRARVGRCLQRGCDRAPHFVDDLFSRYVSLIVSVRIVAIITVVDSGGTERGHGVRGDRRERHNGDWNDCSDGCRAE